MIIGILGGMGTYATIYAFRQFADMFRAEKEWERPRIIIDNRCTMPSRVRAFLFDENKSILIYEMMDSFHMLLKAGCDRIIVACNTAHIFLPEIYEKMPELKGKVLNLVDNCVKRIRDKQITKVFLVATEGTIESGIYQNALLSEGIVCMAPRQEEYNNIRKCIEAVKQNKYTDADRKIFIELINRYKDCVIACTELPILYEKYKDGIISTVYDPLYMGLSQIHEEFLQLN